MGNGITMANTNKILITKTVFGYTTDLETKFKSPDCPLGKGSHGNTLSEVEEKITSQKGEENYGLY